LIPLSFFILHEVVLYLVLVNIQYSMKKKKTVFSTRSMRFQLWKQIILAILLVTAVAFLYDGYRRTKKSAIENYSIQQMIYADQIVNDISFKFELIRNVLELWSSYGEIVLLSNETVECMEEILEAHGSYISGVTRMDENGIIRYTVPYYEGSIGADISYQEHIQHLLQTHQAVLSDAFMTVQGYWAVVCHVPCFDKEGNFSGSLAFLVPFREMFRELFARLLPENDTVPLVLGNDGLILFSPEMDQEGKLYTEVFSDDNGLLEVADEALSGRRGYMLTDFTTYVEDPDQPERMLSTIVPFSFQGISWNLILSVPEETVMSNISGMSNRWLGGMLAIIFLALVYSTLKARVWIASKEEKKWLNVARLKNVLIRTIDQADEAIVILDDKERVIYANGAAVALASLDKIHHNIRISEILTADFEPSISALRKNVAKKGNWSGRVKGKGVSDHDFILNMTISSVIDSDGALTNFIIIARDVATEIEMEKRLLEHQKMEAIGQLAGGIAHDFNNILVGVLGYAELLKERYSKEDEVVNAADVIIAAVHQGSDLTRQLLGYARKGKHQIVRIDFGRSVREVNRILKRTLDQRINIILDLDEGIYVKGDSTQIEQVILNLAVNARDAMPDGGELKFTLKRETVSSVIIDGKPDGESLEFAVLKTIDSGSGILDEHLERIFEPFFTTKDEEGTGMGLATVYGVVENHGGWVSVDSKPGEGTMFTVYLPLDTCSVDEVREKHGLLHDKESKGRGGTILVVDDEFTVVATLTALLEEIGYSVVSVPGGMRALEVYAADPDGFDAVLLDLSMPEMDGKECFVKLREIDPEVKVILATGYSRNGRVQELLDLGVKGFLQKPFRLNELAVLLSDLIDK